MTRPLVSKAIGNLKWGVKGGLTLAVFYSLWIGLVFLIGGADTFGRLGVSPTTVIAAYVTMGVLAGAVIGLLRPLTGNGFGAFVVGYLAAVPIAAGGMICFDGWPSTRRIRRRARGTRSSGRYSPKRSIAQASRTQARSGQRRRYQ